MSDKSTIKKSFLIFSSGTFISRIFGLLRDVSISAFFKPEHTDIFFVAFKIPNLFRRILGESAITLSVVPILSEYKNDLSKLKTAVNSIFTAFIFVLVFVCILGHIFTPEILKLVVPDFFLNQDKANMAIYMTRIIFPYIALISITAFYMGILNTVGHFFATSIHPVFFNLGIIIFALFSKYFNPELMALAYGCIFGGILQVLINIPFLRKFKLVPIIIKKIDWFLVKKVLKLLLPSLISASAIPLTILINTYFAAKTGVGNISYLNWADRLVELPLGVFAVAISTAVLPVFSSNNISKLIENYAFSLKLCFFILLPATAGILALNLPLVKVIFQRGSFDIESTKITASALSFLILTLLPSGLIRVTVSLFYAVKNSLIPALCSVISLIVNFTICYFTTDFFGLNAITFAITASSFANIVFLLFYFNIKYHKIKFPNFLFTAKIILISTLTYFITKYISSLRNWNNSLSFINDFAYLILCIFIGTLVFLFSSYLLKIFKEIDKKFLHRKD